MELYTYFRSSAAYRVRIALNLKGIAAEQHAVHLVRDGGEQHREGYKALNPNQLVPTLLDDGQAITQSLAICEYLEERYPQPPLLPPDAMGRARVRSLSLTVACDIHPLNNLRVLQYLGNQLHLADDARNQWYRHWMETGLQALETMLAKSAEMGRFCHGDTPTLADICLVPQLYNARRYAIDLTPYPTLLDVDAACCALPAFAQAAPERQPDAA